jgi:oxygen-independent coproporphyrinogen-3 oxidase
MRTEPPNGSAGIYIHVPFCQAKCGYCGFASIPWENTLAERYWRAVVLEIERYAAAMAPARQRVETIYLGGGTPSILPVEQVAALLKACSDHFDVVPNCEISMEANPGTLSSRKTRAYLELGVNRISIGAQSFSDSELTDIGRAHRADQIERSFALLRSVGFQNLNLDLILGLPGQSLSRWQSNLMNAVNLAPRHLSIYMLELDPKTPLFHAVACGEKRLPDEDEIADWYLGTIDLLESRGYGQYEISNFALPGFECRHNVKYWLREPVLAFGAAAHSFDGISRYANPSDLSSYLTAVEKGRSPVLWRERADEGRNLEETIILGLRLNRGLDWDQLRKSFDTKRLAAHEASFRQLEETGLVEWKDAEIRLTRRGMLLSNEVFQKFINSGA